MIDKKTINETIRELAKKYPQDKDRINKGVNQSAELWNKDDGSEKDFKEFCIKNFVESKDINKLLEKFERKYEKIDGHFTALLLELRHELDEDTGPMDNADNLFSSFNPATHLSDDLFKTKIAFLALLNFEAKDLKEKLKDGHKWSREQWATSRLAERHLFRIPSEIQREITNTYSKSAEYVYGYNIPMGRIRDINDKKIFDDKLSLISHWGLRDQLKSYYSNSSHENLNKQKTIYKIMERIIYQDMPYSFIKSEKDIYNPFKDELNFKTHKDRYPLRYKHLLEIFKAHRKEDIYYKKYPTKLERSFNKEREIPQNEIENMFKSILASKAFSQTAELIKRRLNRDLEPFDIWYDGFKSRGAISGEELDKIVQRRYSSLEELQKDIPQILEKLGFDKKTALYLSERIEIDPSRGAGHAWGPEMRGEKAHLRTKAANGKINYQTFNVAMHELGHCVEQVFSLYSMDHTILSRVPNTAFTEGFAFVFQDRDLEVLGIKQSKDKDMKALDILWSSAEIAGVALTDIKTWEWMYSHKKFDEYELKEAVIKIAKDIWNRYYAPVFGVKDSPILAVYSHMIYHAIYLPDYPLGHIIAYQIEKFFETNSLGENMERMCKIGSVTPKQWMIQAINEEIKPEPMIQDAMKALEKEKSISK
jgi:hypothetical protein